MQLVVLVCSNISDILVKRSHTNSNSFSNIALIRGGLGRHIYDNTAPEITRTLKVSLSFLAWIMIC